MLYIKYASQFPNIILELMRACIFRVKSATFLRHYKDWVSIRIGAKVTAFTTVAAGSGLKQSSSSMHCNLRDNSAIILRFSSAHTLKGLRLRGSNPVDRVKSHSSYTRVSGVKNLVAKLLRIHYLGLGQTPRSQQCRTADIARHTRRAWMDGTHSAQLPIVRVQPRNSASFVLYLTSDVSLRPPQKVSPV